MAETLLILKRNSKKPGWTSTSMESSTWLICKESRHAPHAIREFQKTRWSWIQLLTLSSCSRIRMRKTDLQESEWQMRFLRANQRMRMGSERERRSNKSRLLNKNFSKTHTGPTKMWKEYLKSPAWRKHRSTSGIGTKRKSWISSQTKFTCFKCHQAPNKMIKFHSSTSN